MSDHSPTQLSNDILSAYCAVFAKKHALEALTDMLKTPKTVTQKVRQSCKGQTKKKGQNLAAAKADEHIEQHQPKAEAAQVDHGKAEQRPKALVLRFEGPTFVHLIAEQAGHRPGQGPGRVNGHKVGQPQVHAKIHQAIGRAHAAKFEKIPDLVFGDNHSAHGLTFAAGVRPADSF